MPSGANNRLPDGTLGRYSRAMSRLQSHPLFGVALGLIGVTLFGATLPVTKLALGGFDPAFLTFARALIATVSGAIALFLYGWASIGLRKTAIFAAIAYPLSLTSELLGTGTGWPFGNYAYTDFLGPKALDHVPWSIPASWFYMGFASYLLGCAIVDRLGGSRSWLVPCLAGAWLLTAWDLVLDPAMAHESLRITFWVWDESGPYFGMPIKNFIGWTVTAFLFMALSRLAWRAPAQLRGSLLVPLVVFIANMIFAIVISASVDLWVPIIAAVLVGIAPLLLIQRERFRIAATKRDPLRA